MSLKHQGGVTALLNSCGLYVSIFPVLRLEIPLGETSYGSQTAPAIQSQDLSGKSWDRQDDPYARQELHDFFSRGCGLCRVFYPVRQCQAQYSLPARERSRPCVTRTW